MDLKSAYADALTLTENLRSQFYGPDTDGGYAKLARIRWYLFKRWQSEMYPNRWEVA